MGIKLNHEKMKWMCVVGTTRVNRLQHGAYRNLMTDKCDSYEDHGCQVVKCSLCEKHMQRRCLERHLQCNHADSQGTQKVEFFSPTPDRCNMPRRWVVEKPPVACPVPFCPYMATTIMGLHRHMAFRHEDDELHIYDTVGYYKCHKCNMYIQGC